MLTDDRALQARIASPRHNTPKTYLAPVSVGGWELGDLAPGARREAE